MSQENVEVLRQGIRALNARDRAALAQIMREDAEWRPALTAGGHLEGAVYRGVDGIARYFDDLDAEFDNTDVEVETLEPIDGDRVFFSGRVHAQGKASGINLDVPIWAVWELRERKIQRGIAFLNEADALEAAGLRE
jgi:ketosteroid isomerase-like protein